MKYLLALILFALSFAASAVTCSGSGTITGTQLTTGKPMLLILDNGIAGVYTTNTTPNSGVVPQYLPVGAAPVQSVTYLGTVDPLNALICDATQPGGYANVFPLSAPPPVIPSVNVVAPVATNPGPQSCGGPVPNTTPTTNSITATWAATKVNSTDVNISTDKVPALTVTTVTSYTFTKFNSYWRNARLRCGVLYPGKGAQIPSPAFTLGYDLITPFVFGETTISLMITTTGTLPQIVTYDADSMTDANGVSVSNGSPIAPGTYILSKTVNALYGTGGTINVSLQ